MMHARRSLSTLSLLTLAVVGALALWLAAPAAAHVPPDHAGGPTTGSGTAVITDLEVMPVRDVGGNRFEDRILTGVTIGEGTLQGTFAQEVSGKVRGDQVVFRGTMTFTGTVGDCGEGTIRLGITGKGEIPEPGWPVTIAQVRVIESASNTVSVTGHGTVKQDGPWLSYDIRYSCR
jgi:hypothetical protein